MSHHGRNTTLGVVAISHNEERDLPGFLAHLATWVDEIVIVDDGSTDQTPELVRGAGDHVRLISAPRRPGEYFADQRNKGIDASTADWLLHMDIDERVPVALAREVRARIRTDAFVAYRFRRKNFFLHRPMHGGGWVGWNQVHLARRDVLRFGGQYHETCELSEPEPRVGQLDSEMWHLNDETYAERLRKSALYQQEVAASLLSRGKDIRALSVGWAWSRQFLVNYVWKRGFLDGGTGLIWALHAASATMRAHVLAWDEQHRVERRVLEHEIAEQWDAVREPL